MRSARTWPRLIIARIVFWEQPSAAAAAEIDIPTAWYVPALVPGGGGAELVAVVPGVMGRGYHTAGCAGGHDRGTVGAGQRAISSPARLRARGVPPYTLAMHWL